MKKLLIFLFAAFLFISCNNGGIGGGWSKSDQNTFVTTCTEKAGGTAQVKQICSCIMLQLEKKYPTSSDADRASQDEIQQMAQKCKNGGDANGKENTNRFNGIGDDDNKKNDNDENFGNNDNGNNNNDGGGWTSQQRRQYIKECSGAAVQQGSTQEQADSYCECMTSKVEQQYSFKEANQLTTADFQTPEWQNAAAKCRARY